MSNQYSRYLDELATLPPAPLAVRRYAPWVIWLVALPLVIWAAIQLSR